MPIYVWEFLIRMNNMYEQCFFFVHTYFHFVHTYFYFVHTFRFVPTIIGHQHQFLWQNWKSSSWCCLINFVNFVFNSHSTWQFLHIFIVPYRHHRSLQKYHILSSTSITIIMFHNCIMLDSKCTMNTHQSHHANPIFKIPKITLFQHFLNLHYCMQLFTNLKQPWSSGMIHMNKPSLLFIHTYMNVHMNNPTFMFIYSIMNIHMNKTLSMFIHIFMNIHMNKTPQTFINWDMNDMSGISIFLSYIHLWTYTCWLSPHCTQSHSFVSTHYFKNIIHQHTRWTYPHFHSYFIIWTIVWTRCFFCIYEDIWTFMWTFSIFCSHDDLWTFIWSFVTSPLFTLTFISVHMNRSFICVHTMTHINIHMNESLFSYIRSSWNEHIGTQTFKFIFDHVKNFIN